jgi:gliding motility-associated-like protein
LLKIIRIRTRGFYIAWVFFTAFFPALGLAGKIITGGDGISYVNYIQNKGQWAGNVLYKADFRGGNLFVENTAFTCVFYPKEGIDHHDAHHRRFGFHALRMNFDGASAHHATEAEEVQEFYHNYFIGSDPKKWATQVPVCKMVIHKNMYPGIDVKVFGRGNNIRYDFMVSPGADPKAIVLKFTGQERLSIRNEQLVIVTSVGEIIQEKPYAYQEKNGKRSEVTCRYVLSGNKVSIDIIGNYDKAFPLIIDPTIIFSTYTGSASDNWGMSAGFDQLANAYTAGICFGTGYPTTPGAFQLAFDSIVDISLTKFNPTGTALIFSTYLGGKGLDSPQSITVDNNNCLVVLGRSSSLNFPVVTGCFKPFKSGGPLGTDMILTKFNPAGTSIVASTYMGGSSDDGVNISDDAYVRYSLKNNYSDDARGAVHVDQLNNIYVASTTSSPDFPVTAGCFQPTQGGMQDGCVFKFDPTLTSLIFSSYLGGSDNDAAYNLAIDSQDRIYVTGGTESINFPTTPGVIKPAYQGAIDGFVTHFSFSGSSILQSTYIGTNKHDQTYFIQTDKNDNVYLFGNCRGSYPISANTYSNPNSGQFLHKLDPTLATTIFSTMFGSGDGGVDIVPSAFLVDRCENIYVSGWGGPMFGGGNIFFNDPNSSTVGMPITASAYQSSTDGSDFYFAAFKKNAVALHYATFFGGLGAREHVDGGTSCFDKTGMCYQAICASCGGLQNGTGGMPTTPGVWSSTNASSNCNNGLVKFQMDLLSTLAQANLNLPSKVGCAPFVASFLNYSANAVNYIWDFGDGTFSTAAAPSHTYTNVGTYTVYLIAIDSTTCNQRDTTSLILTVLPPNPSVPQMSPATICKGNSISLNINYPVSATYSWQPAGQLSNPTVANPVAFPFSTTIYTLTLIDTVCNVSVTRTVMVEVKDNSTKIVPSNTNTCNFAPIILSTNPVSVNYKWSFAKTTPTIQVFTAGLYTVSTIDVNGCKSIDSIRISMPVAVASSYTSTCRGGSVQLFGPSGSYQYQWSPPQYLSSTSVFNPLANPPVTTVYTLSIPSGTCITSNTHTVIVNQGPPVKIVNTQVDFCTDDSLTLGLNGVYSSYSWNTGNSNSSITILNSGFYSVTVTDTIGCSGTDTLRVKLYPTLKVGSGLNILCKGQTVQFFAPTGSGYIYKWYPSAHMTGTALANPIAAPPSSIVYTLVISNGTCFSTAQQSVIVHPVPSLSLNLSEVSLYPGEEVQLIAKANMACTWYPDYGLSCTNCDAPIASPEEQMVYYCYVINEFGCGNTDSITVDVVPSFYIPNTFTPNGDDLNEFFRPVFSGYVELNMMIFDRWGALIYSTNMVDGAWDGRYKGKPAEIGAYVYKIEARDYKHRLLEKTGHVILLR